MRRYFLVAAALALPLSFVSGARAGIIVGSPNLPPPGQYVTPAEAHQLYNAGALTIEVVRIRHFGFSASFPPPQNVGDSTLHTFGSTLQGFVSVNGGPLQPFSDPATVSVDVTKASGPNGSPLGTFNTQMTQLNVLLADFGGAEIRIDPVTPSLGSTTIADAGGGMFAISSFFDIFTDLSLDGGATWIPSQISGHVDLVPNPEPSALISISIGAIVCLGTLRASRIRRRARGN
jgi:hypothetical protein